MQFRQNNVPDQSIREPRVLAQRECDILENAEIGEQGTVLEQHAEALTQLIELRNAERRYINAVDMDRTLLRDELPRYQA